MRPSDKINHHRDRIIAVLAREGFANPRLFGSTARRTDNEHSDIDLLVDPLPQASLFTQSRAALSLEALPGCRVDLIRADALDPIVAKHAAAELRPL